MPNENRAQNNFYRCKEKIPVNFSIFLPYPNKRCSLFDNWFLKAEKIFYNNLSGNTPRQLKMLPVFGFDFLYELFTRNKIKSI